MLRDLISSLIHAHFVDHSTRYGIDISIEDTYIFSGVAESPGSPAAHQLIPPDARRTAFQTGLLLTLGYLFGQPPQNFSVLSWLSAVLNLDLSRADTPDGELMASCLEVLYPEFWADWKDGGDRSSSWIERTVRTLFPFSCQRGECTEVRCTLPIYIEERLR